MRAVPAEYRAEIKKELAAETDSVRRVFTWMEFAKHRPVLFFLLLMFQLVFQTSIKLLTAPIKTIHRFCLYPQKWRIKV